LTGRKTAVNTHSSIRLRERKPHEKGAKKSLIAINERADGTGAVKGVGKETAWRKGPLSASKKRQRENRPWRYFDIKNRVL